MKLVIRILACMALLLLATPLQAQQSGVQQQVVALLTSQQRMALPIERIRPALMAYYVNGHAPAYWSSPGRMDAFINKVSAAGDDGLNPDDYPIDTLAQLRDASVAGDASAAAQAELYYAAFFVAYASDLRTGRIAPQKVDPNQFRNPKVIDPFQALSALGRAPNPARALAAFEPRNTHYVALKQMLKVYSDAIRSGLNWPVIGPGPATAPGGNDARMPALRQLLALTGDYEGPASSSTQYDSQLARAVVLFQTRHGLEAKGLLGKQTVLALNIPPAERKKQIIINMERWRWLPDDLGAEHFLVNIAGFELEHVLQGTVVDHMNVVVGAVATQTPEFSGAMQYIELNPYWNVPSTIAVKEMLPKLRANPLAYADDFEVFARGRPEQWGAINWASVSPAAFPFTFRQKPGPKNALGVVKFMLPNRFDIYLHDTPAKDKFFNTTRAFSHGCIRLSKPRDLAYSMLARKGLSPEAVDAIWEGGQNQRVDLPKAVPVHIVYATAFSSDNGIEFRTDVYGRDKKLYDALFARRPAT